MTPRVAIGGFHTECSTYSPVLIRAGDFRQLRGLALLEHPEFHVLRQFNVAWAPLVHWRSVPGGPVDPAAYAAFKAEFLERLAAADTLDGVYLSMHGAANVMGMDDLEGDFLAAVREAVGPDCPIAASYDLHGNVSQRVIDALDIFAAYRTAPHLDVDETKARAVAMLAAHLAGGPRPFLAWARMPVLLPGERTSSFVEPARSLYARLPALDAVAGVLDANLMVGYVWADEPRATACAVVTGTGRDAMAQAAAGLAAGYFAARHGFTFGPRTESLATCLDLIEATPTRTIVLSDSGDNPTAGGTGDRAEVLAELLARNFQDALVAGIADRPAVAACYAAGIGATIPLSIGATLNPAGSTPVQAQATVLALAPDTEGEMGEERQAAVRIAGVTAIICARRRPYYNRVDYDPTGLDPAAFRLLVVKLGYLMPDLAAIANPALMALTGGVVDQDIPRLPVRRIHRPSFPWDPDFPFTPHVVFSERAP